MAIAVIGASGKTGRLIIDCLLRDGHRLRAISRNRPKGLTNDDMERVTFVRGDVSRDDPRLWMTDIDAVVFTAAGDAHTENAVDHLGAARCAAAAKDAGVSRFVLVSAHGAHDPTSWGGEFQSYLEAKGSGEAAVLASLQNATVIRPGILTDDPGTGKATIRTNTGPGDPPVTRTDVANIVAACVAKKEAQGALLEIVGGETEIGIGLEQCLSPAV